MLCRLLERPEQFDILLAPFPPWECEHRIHRVSSRIDNETARRIPAVAGGWIHGHAWNGVVRLTLDAIPRDDAVTHLEATFAARGDGAEVHCRSWPDRNERHWFGESVIFWVLLALSILGIQLSKGGIALNQAWLLMIFPTVMGLIAAARQHLRVRRASRYHDALVSFLAVILQARREA